MSSCPPTDHAFRKYGQLVDMIFSNASSFPTSRRVDFFALFCYNAGDRGKAPGSPFVGVGSAALVGALALFLCLRLAVANDLRGGFGVLGGCFNQLGDVLQIRIELGGGSLVHFLI